MVALFEINASTFWNLGELLEDWVGDAWVYDCYYTNGQFKRKGDLTAKEHRLIRARKDHWGHHLF